MTTTDQLQLNPTSDVPLVTQLVDQLTWLIASGQVDPGELLPPIRQLAEFLNINLHTVRQAYHRLEQDGLVEVRRRRGTMVLEFDPTKVIRQRSRAQSFLLGVLMPAPAPVYRGLLSGIYAAADEAGWMPLVAYTGDSPLVADRYFHQLIAKGVDGIIVVSVTSLVALLELQRAGSRLPVIHVDSPEATGTSLLANSEQAAFLATEHLIEHGYQNIGFITPPLHWGNVAPCMAGFERAFHAKGKQVPQRHIVEVADFSGASGYQGIHQLLEHAPSAEAAFIASDSLALGALRALRERELSVPADFALASYNDIDEAELVTPPLTTATFPARQLGELAVEELLRSKDMALECQKPIVLETELVVRQSCGCSPTS